MHPKLVALFVAAALTTGWLLASIVSPPVAELQSLPSRERPRPAPRSEEVAIRYTEQLHLKLQQAPIAPVPRRNPFVFERTRPATVVETSRPADPETQVVDAPMVPLVTGPSLRLSGIGSNDTPEGPVRTAVISDGRTVHLIKVGGTLAGYEVVEITEDSATLANAAGARWMLRLK